MSQRQCRTYIPPSAATGGKLPIRYSLSSLGDGLRFDASSRTISGTPTKYRDYTVWLTATDSSEYPRTALITVNISIDTNMPKSVTVTATLKYGSTTATRYDVPGGSGSLPAYRVVYNVEWSASPAGTYTLPALSDSRGRQVCGFTYWIRVYSSSATAGETVPCVQLGAEHPNLGGYRITKADAERHFRGLHGARFSWTCRWHPIALLGSHYTCS